MCLFGALANQGSKKYKHIQRSIKSRLFPWVPQGGLNLPPDPRLNDVANSILTLSV